MTDSIAVHPKQASHAFALQISPRSESHHEKAIIKRKIHGLPAMWIICLVVLAISAVSALPIMGISILQTQSLGDKLLQEVAEQQFNVMHVSIQAALDEGDYWADSIEGWLRHQPPPLHVRNLTAQMKSMMLSWLSSVAKRVGGMCSAFVNEMNPYGQWQFCAVRMLYQGNIEYHWEYMPNSTIMYEVRTDQYFNLLDTVASWPAYKLKPQFNWSDGRKQWDQPSIWPEGNTVITQIGQYRMVKTGNATIVNRFWMEDKDWAQVLRNNLNASLTDNMDNPPIAFLFSDQGMIITTTCGSTNLNGNLIRVNESDCGLVRQTFAAVQRDGYLAKGAGFYRANLPAGPYLLGLSRIEATRSGETPYFLATAYPYSAVDEPVTWTISLLVIVCVCTMVGTIIVASFLTSFLIASPLRDVAKDLDRCVELDVNPFSHRRTPIRELSSILDSLGKVKGTLQAVTMFVPVPVVQRSLRMGEVITMSMTPTVASIMFLDIQNFTKHTESTELSFLVTSVAAFFHRLSELVVKNHGVIDKYIGDCMMSFWNTPTKDPLHQLHACQAAMACIAAMEDPIPDLLQLTGRIGLESGSVYAGLFGSPHRMNYTVVGDVVNVASRLESLNKQCGTRVLMGPFIHAAVADDVITRQLAPMDIRGKAEKLVPHELLGLADPSNPYGLRPTDAPKIDSPKFPSTLTSPNSTISLISSP